MPLPGLMRDMKYIPEKKQIWGLNWKYGDFVIIDPKSLQVICTVDLFKMGITKPFSLEYSNNKLYISAWTPSVLGEYSLEMNNNDDNDDQRSCTLKLNRSIDFQKIGYTELPESSLFIEVNDQQGTIYNIVGMLEKKYQFGLVELDQNDFKIKRDLRLTPAYMKYVKQKDSFIIADYYLSKMVIVSRKNFEIIREIEVDPKSFSLVFDPGRDLIYTISNITGNFQVTDYNTGKVLKKFFVGAKPSGMDLDPANDTLYLGSMLGIVEIDLKKLVPSSHE
jgi:hypothetical protein